MRRRCAAVMLVLGPTFWVSAAANGATGHAPSIFDVAADAAVVMSEVSAPSAVPLVVALGAGRSSVASNSQPNVVAESAPFYSPIAETAPSVFKTPPPPEPVWCYSYFPGDPREAACGGPTQAAGPFVFSGGSGHTSTSGDAADPTTLTAESSTSIAALRSTGPPPETIGSGASAASTGRDGDRITGGASTALHAVDIGGVLKISSISSKVTGALGGLPGTGAATTEFVIGTASVSGQPVTIDGDGVHAVGQNVSGLVGAQQQVDQALATAGIAVRTAPAASPAVASDGTRLEVSSSGVIATVTQPQQSATVILGQSKLAMSAFQAGNQADLSAAPSPDASPVGGESPLAPTVDNPGETSTVGAALPPPAPVPGATSGAPRSGPFRRELSAAQLGGHEWRIPYAPFAMLVFSLPVLVAARRLSVFRRLS